MPIDATEMFGSLLEEGLNKTKTEVSLPVQNYIEELLVFYLRSDRVFEVDKKSGKRNLRTLTEYYYAAQQSSSNKGKNYFLKQIGDRSLYLSGFFKDFLNQKLVGIDYYINMGKNAYESLASCQTQNKILSGIFSELSYCFLDIMSVMSYISQKGIVKNSDNNNKDLLGLCRYYLESGPTEAMAELEGHDFYFSKKKH